MNPDPLKDPPIKHKKKGKFTMKNMRKLFAILLAVMLIMSLAATVSATPEGTLTGGSITIKDAVSGHTYNAYQLMYLESYDATAKTYTYKANSAWAEWLRTQTSYVAIDGQGYVTWVDGADVAAFAKAAQTKAKSMTADKTAVAASATVSFTDLNLGYYLVDTTLGTLCALDTTNPSVEMEEKNVEPTISKYVLEDSDQSWGDMNDAAIGDIVEFKVVISAYGGAENYVLHDTLGTGLTLKADTIVVEGLTKDTDYTVTTPDDDCSFEIAFSQDYLDTITGTADSPKTITVTYIAELNADAVVGEPGNSNSAVLTYGEKNVSTQPATTTTHTWSMQVFKYGDGDVNKPLAGAKFVLMSGNTVNGSVAEVVDEKVTVWHSLRGLSEVDLPDYALTTNERGYITINGLDSDTYYLREIEAPAGYNKLSEDKTVTVRGAGHNTIADINNQSGTELPSTGGMGTTILYIIGGVLVLAAVVLLVMKKRMSAAE